MTLPPPSLPRFVLLTGAIIVCPAVAMDIYLPAIPQITGSLGGTVEDGQLTVTLFFLGFALGQMVFGTAADAYGRRPMLLLGLLLYIATSLACALSPSMDLLIAARVLQGIGAGAGAVLGRILVRDRFEGAAMARVMSYVMSILILGPIVAPVIGAALLEAFGWRWIFGFVAAWGLAIFVLVLLVQGETHIGRGASAMRPGHVLRSYRTVLSHSGTRLYVAVNTLGFSALLIYLSTISAVVIEDWGWSPPEMALVFAIVAACIAVGGLANARLLLRWQVGRMLRIGLVLGIAGGSFGALLSRALPHLASLHELQIAAFCCAMLGFSLVVSNSTALAVQAHGARAGVATAVLGVVQTLGAAAIGTILSIFHDGTAALTFMAFAGVNLLALILLLSASKEAQSS
ncbi:MAG: multidrug effflux MFS transporter [Sneathiellaceae bacterium]